MRLTLGIVALSLLVAGCKGKGPAGGAEVSFSSVQPIFSQRCARCHGGASPKFGIDLSTYEGAMKGGKEGPVITAGDPQGSVLVQALRGQNGKKQMPFRSTPLPAEQIQTIEDWIKAGAKQS